jgi:hypothetical protein
MARTRAGPYLSSARAKKTPGKTVRPGGTQVIKARGKKPIAFTKGGLHKSLGVPQGEKIPQSKLNAALRGDYGKKAQKQARFATNVLAKGQRTARRGK